MAAYYFHIIESLQPEGPYDLGGYSLGGVLAYEVARRLQEMGHTVETLVMLEPPDSTHLRKISPLKKGDMLRAVNMALLMTIRQEPGKITQTLVHRDEVNLDVPEEVFLRRLITLAKPRGLANTDAQLRAFIRQCAKVQGAYEYGNYVEHPLPDPQGVTAYYFLKTGEAFYGELKPYFTVRDDEMPLDHTNFWQGWRELLPRLHMLEVNAPNHLMLLTEPEAYETISRFCRALYSGKGAPPGFLESFKSKSKKVNEKKRTDEVYTMSNTSTVFMFPGQGAQRKGMGEGLFDEFKELTRKADKILGYSIKELCLEDNDGRLVQTQFTQPAGYGVNALSYLKRNRTGSGPGYVLGHSVGEYNALFASGVIDFESGLRLVKKRGELMSQATGGGMAAVMGLSEDKVGEILEQNNLDNLYIANYNSPRQIVISGLKKDIEQAESLFLDLGAAHYRVLNVGGAFHTPYMADAKEKFKDFVNEFDFGRITIPIIANVTARPYKQEEIRDNMIEQITGPVRWTESIRWLLARGVDIDDMDEIGLKGLSVVKALAIRTNNYGAR
jgi:malonyl CoA-acyl carrier protein transacylase